VNPYGRLTKGSARPSSRRSKPRAIGSWQSKWSEAVTEPISGLAAGARVAFEQFSIDHGRTAPVGFLSFVGLEAHTGSNRILIASLVQRR
jgi:hypothetical protein